jgi:hypothetical protein
VQSVCEFKNPQPPTSMAALPPGYTTPQTPALASPQPSLVTAGDWCSGLVYLPPSASGSGMIGNIQFYAPPLDFEQGTVSFNADNHLYEIVNTQKYDYTTHFTPSCLQAYGASPTCQELSDALNAQPLPNYQDLSCANASDGGCDCTYTLSGTGGDNGTWEVVGSTLYEFPSLSGLPPQAVDFCAQGDTMTLSGKNGSHLNGTAGMRSMFLTKCTDGVCDPGGAQPQPGNGN